jgi:hypothetical protein
MVDTVLMSILQIRKVRYREGDSLTFVTQLLSDPEMGFKLELLTLKPTLYTPNHPAHFPVVTF